MPKLPRFDCHLHTNFSPCALSEMSVENILDQARTLELQGLCLTDHLHPETELEQFRQLRAELAEIPVADLQLWIGCEAEILSNAKFSIDAADVDAMDLVLVAPFHGVYCLDRPADSSTSQIAEFMLRQLNRALDCPGVRIVVHPLWIALEWPFDLEGVIKIILDSQALTDLLARAANRGVAMEVNPKMLEVPFWALIEPFYLRCLEQNVRLSFGSDAHSLGRMDMWDAFDQFFNRLGGDANTSLWLPHEQLASV